MRMCKFRPTPPHLTSVLAEQLLARACENEADNAKRMRMGMEPVSQVLMKVITLVMTMMRNMEKDKAKMPMMRMEPEAMMMSTAMPRGYDHDDEDGDGW